MKIRMVTVALFFSGFTAFADVDLDAPLVYQSLAVTGPVIDISGGFPEIHNQSPLGACQSYAMAAWLDYIFFYKTGQMIDLSEKQMAYGLISYLADEFWNAKTDTYPKEYLGKDVLTTRPNLGSGIAPLMLEAYLRSYAVPNSIYSFGDMSAAAGPISVDVEHFKKYFESDLVAKRAEYLQALDQAFFAKPPENFLFKLKTTNFANGQEETLDIRNGKELAEWIGITRENVTTYYNQDYNSQREPITKEAAGELLSYFNSVSQHFKHRSSVVPPADLHKAIVDSLNRRMAVMIAADVFMGDWTSGVVYAGGGGHALVIVGYQVRDGKTYFKLRNSWGKDRLVGGYNFIESSALLSNTLYIVTHD